MNAKNILHFILKTVAVSVVMLLVTILISLVRPLAEGQNSGQDEGTVMALLFVITTVYALVVGLVVVFSRGTNKQLIPWLVIAFFGVQTVVGQIEAFFFLTPLGEKWGAGSISVLQMPVNFIISQFIVWGAVTIVGIPLAVYLFGRKRQHAGTPVQLIPNMSNTQWITRLGMVILAYELLYFGFGYYVAWKDPAIQAFYQGTDPGSFFTQMQHVFSETPGLPVLQAFRAMLWTVFLIPVVRMLNHRGWTGAILTGLFASLPMNIPHIIPNPYMPADVRMVHFIETFSSTFIFGILVFWLFAFTYSSKK